MLPKLKIIFSLIILSASIIISLAFYVENREFDYLRNNGEKRKAIINNKTDSYDIEPKFKMPTKLGTPPEGKHVKFHLTVSIIQNGEYYESSDLYISRKKDWENLQIFDTINIYFDKNQNKLFFANDVEQPPFLIEYYYLFAVVGLFLSILLYSKL